MCWTSFTGCYVRRDFLVSETATLRIPNSAVSPDRFLEKNVSSWDVRRGWLVSIVLWLTLINDFKFFSFGRGHLYIMLKSLVTL